MQSKFDAIIDFSAQFGGRDAAAAILPHFRALKSAAKGLVVSDFPANELAFILRVEGEVSSYGQSGAENLDVQLPTYVSVDIVISNKWRGKTDIEIAKCIGRLLRESVDFLTKVKNSEIGTIDETNLEDAINRLSLAYTRGFGA